MQLIKDPNEGQYIINQYQPGRITINKQVYHQSVIISKEQLFHPWQPSAISELTLEHLQQLVDLQPDLVILGVGEKLVFPEQELLTVFYQNKIGFEVMDSFAAARTYNVLVSEDRNVVVGLMIN